MATGTATVPRTAATVATVTPSCSWSKMQPNRRPPGPGTAPVATSYAARGPSPRRVPYRQACGGEDSASVNSQPFDAAHSRRPLPRREGRARSYQSSSAPPAAAASATTNQIQAGTRRAYGLPPTPPGDDTRGGGAFPREGSAWSGPP